MIPETSNLIKEIEQKLLPIGMEFSDQQKGVLEYSESANIVAGPGSGKTTVLTAKCALLLRENISNSKGICLITHTNIAVEEIRAGLMELGFKNIEYPNFIGTIQDFFYHFFGRKAFHSLINAKRVRILEEEDYREKFDEHFNMLKPQNYTYPNPNPKYKNPKLIIKEDLTYDVISDASSFYRDAFNGSIKTLIGRGIITNEQSLELATWYINKHYNKIREAIRCRFNYVLLDEAQDINNIQDELLNKLFLDTVVYQRFGDPYQALYSIFGSEEDTWKPSEEVGVKRLDISETARFNENIAGIVRNVCFERYDSFSSTSKNNSFPPYFISYDDGEELVGKFNKLICSLEEESFEYKNIKKKDAILSVKHDNLIPLFSFYQKDKLKVKKTENLIKQIYSLVLKVASTELEITISEVEEKLNAKIEIKKRLAILIKKFIINKNVETIITDIINEISILRETSISTNRFKKIKERLENFKKSLEDINENKLNEIEHRKFDKNLYFGTIHSVKGETHRSTLLILNTVFSDFQRSYHFEILDLLKNYVIGNYIDIVNITDTDKKRETRNALKLSYVAFSRPTHLVAIGIQTQQLTEELRNDLKKFGWKEY